MRKKKGFEEGNKIASQYLNKRKQLQSKTKNQQQEKTNAKSRDI